MPEYQPNSEGQGELSSAIKDVIKLCLDDGEMHNKGSIEKRDNSWELTADKFPKYSNNIKKLGNALKDAEEKKKEHADIKITDYPELFFKNVPDEQARKFLVNIWCSRIIVPENPNLLMGTGYTEAQDIISEMKRKKKNIDDSFCEIQPKKTLADVMGLVLKGELKMTHQPKQRS